MKALKAAWERRKHIRELLENQNTNAYRLLEGEGEDVPGLTIDVYDRVAVLNVYEGQWGGNLESVASWCLENAAVRSVYKKSFVVDRSQKVATETMYSSTPFAGETAPAEIEILETGLKYIVQPYSGYSTGIFLDQRNNRRLLASRAAGKRILNLFAYTCAFSVGCAAKGAQVTSVDLSKKYLEWGKRNFASNGIVQSGTRFICDDAFLFCQKEARRKNSYDLVIVDPPSFSRDKKGRVFSLEKDFSELVSLAGALVAKGGELFVSCNAKGFDNQQIARHLAALNFTRLEMPSLPEDFSFGHSLSYGLARN